jgi:hypothetical protein
MEKRERIKLTRYSTEAGWASEFAPGDLKQALEGLAPASLVGFVRGLKTCDDAGHSPFGADVRFTA